ncbi:MAG: lamin tail domain-containing protein [Phycisphaerales bacterium]
MFRPGVSHAQVVINEVMASNTASFADPQGDFDDWIELYNVGDGPVDVGGMYLTDNPEEPTKWQIPANSLGATTLAAGKHLLIWTDGDTGDYVPVEQTGARMSGPPASGFHASFRLDAGGDEVHLFDVDGVTPIDSLAFDEQTTDVSYGRYPDGSDALRFFGVPTPGAQNNEGYLGEVAPLQFSHERGFYTAEVTRGGGTPGFDLTITTVTPDARIIYTLDGTAPNASGYRIGPGTDYAGPIRITSTTCLRVMALKDGWKPTKIYTQTYIFDSRDQIQSLPVISLVGDAKNTLYEPNGVMAIVGGTYPDGVWASSGAGSYNNMLDREMERPVSAEWIVPGEPAAPLRVEDEDFQIDCGLRVHGSPYMRPRYVRQNSQWSGSGKISLRLYFRGDYGQSRLKYPLFALSDAEQFATVVLRAGHNDQTNPFIKDELLRRLHRDMGQVACMGTFANLFINGQYKGYYNPTEHVKEESCQQWFGSDQAWDVMTMNGIRDGDSQSWDAMINYARNHNLADSASYAELCKRLDVECFIDYLIIRLWPNDWDWPQNNWAAACERSPTGKWKFFVWDAEGTFESGQVQANRFSELNNQGNGNAYLYRALKANKDFRLLFADRVYKHFFNGGALTQANVSYRFSEMRQELQSVLANMNTSIVDSWVPNRRDVFLNACVSEGMYTFAGPEFRVAGASRYGGNISLGESLQIVSSVQGTPVYYTLDGSDPGPSASTQSSVVTTLIATDASKRVLVPTGPDVGDWRSVRGYEDSAWLLSSGSPGGVGFERSTGYENYLSLDLDSLMYGINGSCYIRIPFQFSGDRTALEVMTLKMQYDDGFIAYLNGTEVARRNFTGDPAWNSVASASHDDAAAVLFEAIDLSQHIGRLRVGDNLLAIQGMNSGTTSSDFLIGVELTASRQAVSEDPTGAQTYSGPITLAMSTTVKARVQNGSTWSALAEAVFSVGPVRESLRISEIMFRPSDLDDPNSEYVELTNVGDQTINLNLVRFTKGIDFTFADVELAPGAFCLVVKNLGAFEARYGPDLPVVGQYAGSLADAGERIELCDALGAIIHSFEYRDDWFDLTDGFGFSLTVADPAGTALDQWGGWGAWRPSAAPGGSPGRDDRDEAPAPGSVVINELVAISSGMGPDWIELCNTTDEPVDIGGWFLSDDGDDLTRYQIAVGTVLPPQGFLVFTEDEHFGNANDPGCRKPFALSASGETVHLHSGNEGEITGYSERAKFGASDPGTAFGRHENAATGASLVPLTEPTPGEANADPLVGPIVISEIMYHFGGATDVEYVELLNISDANVTLYDPDRGVAWRFTDDPEAPGIDLLFPVDPPITLGPGEYLLIAKDLSLCESQFLVPVGVQGLSWYAGKLRNSGETIQLSRPGELDSQGVRSWIAVDRVHYSDGSRPEDFATGRDLWPVQADGLGYSLTRVLASQRGDNPLNWRALAPSPGTARPRTYR